MQVSNINTKITTPESHTAAFASTQAYKPRRCPEQGLCNVRVYVHLSVPSTDSSKGAGRAVRGQEISIDSSGRRHSAANTSSVT